MSKLGTSILRICASMAVQRPWLVLSVALLLTALAAYAATGLRINTSTDDILSENLPFRQVEAAYERAFPEEDLVIAVVDAPSADQAEAAAQSLAARIGQRRQNFERVEVAGASPYFDRYGLVFLPPEEIRGLGEELRPARRLLLTLGNDPTLRGFASLSGMMAGGVEQSVAPPELAGMLAAFAETVEQRAAGAPAEMQWSRLFDVGGELRSERQVVQMKPILDDASLDRAGPALDALGDAAAEVRAEVPDATIRVTGEPVLRQQELNDAFSGALSASGLSLILVASILTLGIRSGRTILALLVALIIGAVWTTGLAAISVGRLNLISIAFMVLFFGLGIDFGTHLSLRFLEAARRGAPFQDAIRIAMAGEGPSISLSALCAALAFLSFVPTPYVGLAEFGIISALGMLVALVITFTVLPALLSILGPKPSERAARTLGIAPAINSGYRVILIVAGLVTVVAGILAKDVRIDTNPLNLQNPNTEAFRTYRDLARDPETSPYALNALAPDAEAAREMAPRLADLEGVAGVRWIGSFVPEDQPDKLEALAAVRERLGESFFEERAPAPPPSDAELQESFAAMVNSADAIAAATPGGGIDPAIPEAGARFAAALDVFEERQGAEPAALRELGEALTRQMPIIVAGLREKLSVSEPVTIEDIPDDLRRDWISADGQYRLRVLPAGELRDAAAMRVFTERVQSVAPNAAGAPASITGAGRAILLSFAEAIAYTVIAIAVVVTILRRRLSDVLLVLAPLAVAALWTVAGSAVLDLPFNFANVIVIPLLIGLGVASSIHIVGRARELAHENGTPNGRNAEVLDTSTPLAVLITQLNTVAAFATLAIAEHRGLFSMGVLLGLAIFFVLVVSLIVLPAFMLATGISKARPAARPAS